ncbi:hypothetical protein QYF36_001991 [Acer negundo]|nr:hypothetical protein QYF36_001991 [Acer negundo]
MSCPICGPPTYSVHTEVDKSGESSSVDVVRLGMAMGRPDISAPGVGILAGHPPILPPSGFPGQDKRSVKYNLMTGTSVACAHAARAAAYVKSIFHPDWSSFIG